MKGASRAAAYGFEGEAQGGGDYWWHAQGVFTGKHAIVDQLQQSWQRRTTARAAFTAVTPHAFPPGLLIFLSNDEGTTSAWAEIRREFHNEWLDQHGLHYMERMAALDGLIRKDWDQPSLAKMAEDKGMATLVAKCIYYVFFGIWVTEEEAVTLGRWRTLAANFVLPRMAQRLLFDQLVYPIMTLRAETIGIIRKYRLENVFAKMNERLSPANRRATDCTFADELLFAIGFAGIGGTTAGTISAGKFLLAEQSSDAASQVDFGGRDSAQMIQLYQAHPGKFVQETCRISSPVGTFTTVLKERRDLGVVGGPCPEGTYLSGVVNLSNLDPTTFPEPMKFDPKRSNLDNALTWNGAAFGADEDKYPRICPGRYLSKEIIIKIGNIAITANS